MFKKTTIALSAAAAMFAGSAFAQDTYEHEVDVHINVEEEVSMWADHDDVTLTMNGADANNFAGFASTLRHINNVTATITAEVTGDLPDPIVAGGGINFFIFPNQSSVAAAQAAVASNAYTPAGALVWTDSGSFSSSLPQLGASQEVADVPVATSIAGVPVVYAAASPGELPLPNSYDLTVTYTITGD